ncbi:MAG: hypothetical protein L3J49_09355 [Desulfobulbaceae bacterium]|nr:hypothetical protein [Desulfobulbaceae bacterium]
MNTLTFYRRLSLLLVLALFVPWCAQAQQGRDLFTFTLPAPAVLQALQTILPLPLETDSATVNGTISIDSIDTLTIHDNIISLHGVLSGKNLSVSTVIAGQNIRLKLGQLILPLSSDLHLRFDRVGQQLFITPQLKPSQETSSTGGEAILPLMAALDNREYPVDLKKLLSFNPTIGGQRRPLYMEVVGVTAEDNQLILKLRPQKTKSN